MKILISPPHAFEQAGNPVTSSLGLSVNTPTNRACIGYVAIGNEDGETLSTHRLIVDKSGNVMVQRIAPPQEKKEKLVNAAESADTADE